MATIIHVNFGKKEIIASSEDCSALRKAKITLGHNYFKKALLEWSITELKRCVNHPEAILTGASDAYDAILQFRLNRKKSESSLKLIKCG